MTGFKIFQFHKGTIKTASAVDESRKNTRFQFHKGTIKTIGRLRVNRLTI